MVLALIKISIISNMESNYLIISLSIIAIFFITFIVIMIKNIYFNSKKLFKTTKVIYNDDWSSIYY